MNIWAVVLAAGSGSRFGGLKQLEPLNGRRLIDWSVEAARSIADGVVVVLSREMLDTVGPSLVPTPDAVVVGSDTRAGSVRAALSAIDREADLIVIHDAARPLATKQLFEAVVEAVIEGADAAVPGVAVSDTLKRIDGSNVVETVDRDELVAVQTPQAFKASVLRDAHAGGSNASDDAALVEALGASVVVVPGEEQNRKITVTADLDLMRALVKS